jgi:multidrug efflux system membrane fusion protein
VNRRAAALLLAVLVAGGGATYAYLEWAPAGETGPGERRRGGRRGGPQADGPVSVLTAASRVADVPVTLEAVGIAQALHTVTVRSQVDGRLLELTFRKARR